MFKSSSELYNYKHGHTGVYIYLRETWVHASTISLFWKDKTSMVVVVC